MAAKTLLLLSSFILLLFAVFQPGYARALYRSFQKEIMIAATAGTAFYFILMYFQSQWFMLSKSVTIMIYSLLSPFYDVAYSLSGEPIIKVNGFAISIGPPCSGIDSMLLFFSFFAAIFALEHRKLKKKTFIFAALAGLAGVYLVNVARLVLLILVGLHISPEIAVGLFHTNAGWILFVIFFLSYYRLIRRSVYQ